MLVCQTRIVSANGRTTSWCNRGHGHAGYHNFPAGRGAYRFYLLGEMRKRKEQKPESLWTSTTRAAERMANAIRRFSENTP